MNYAQADQWIGAFLEGTIKEEGFVLFKQWLAASPEHADHFMHQVIMLQQMRDYFETRDYENPEKFMALMAQLEKGGTEPVLVDLTETVLHREREARAQRRQQLLTLPHAALAREYVISKALVWMGIAAILGIAVCVGLFSGSDPAPGDEVTVDTSFVQEGVAVAFVTSELNASWGQGVLGQDRALDPDQEVFLEKGIARVVFASGAEVTLQGPIRFKATGRNAAQIVMGRLVADVPPQAMGFTVQTPEGLVTDYGTEFAVVVDEVGSVDTHVFTGEVSFTSTSNDQVVALRAGDAVRATSDGSVSLIYADPLAFVRRDDFKKLVTLQQDAYKRWLAYSQELRRDQATVAYYTFSADDERATLLHNVAKATADGLHGVLDANATTSPTWDAGRFPQKRGLRFDHTKPQWVRVPNDTRLNPGKAITIACWINRAGEGDHSGIFVSKIDQLTAGYSYQLGGFGSNSNHHATRAIQFATSAANVGARESLPVFSPSPDQWEHIAATYDGSTVRFYYNGVPAGSEPMTLPMPASQSDVFIGRDATRAGALSNPFEGVMDELVILSRAMNGDEISNMYKQGIPAGIPTD